MTPENEYFEDVARMRRLLEQALSGDAELPDFLKPENQVVSKEVRERSNAALDALRKGDYEAARKLAKGLIGAGFDRKGDEVREDVPELDQARRKARDRLIDQREDTGDNDSRGRDRRDDSG